MTFDLSFKGGLSLMETPETALTTNPLSGEEPYTLLCTLVFLLYIVREPYKLTSLILICSLKQLLFLSFLKVLYVPVTL